MSCVVLVPGVVVCGPRGAPLGKVVRRCPTEQKHMHMVESFEGYYGISLRCCGCGDSWSDGEMYPRPFQRAWRQRAKAQAQEMYDRALGPEAYGRACQAAMDAIVGRPA